MHRLHIFTLALVLLLASDGRAQGDLDLLSGSAVPPNIMIVLDNSSSMDASVPGDPLGRMRIEVGHDVMVDFINSINPDDGAGGVIERARLGFATFNTENGPYHRRCAGGTIDVPVGPATNKPQLISALDALLDEYVNNGITSSGTCPSETMVDMARYFAEGHVLGAYPTDLTADRDLIEFPEENPGSPKNRKFEPVCPGGPCPSPIDLECRRNFVVLVTDGGPNRDLHNHYGPYDTFPMPDGTFMALFGNADGDANECSLLQSDPAWDPSCLDDVLGGRDDGTYPEGIPRGDWLDDVAYVLNRTDLSPSVPGMQNLQTYPIGFFLDAALLQETADNGGGQYFTAESAEEFELALNKATAGIMDSLAAFSAASVPSSRSAFGDGFYTAFFEPSNDDPFWPGHLQAFRISPDLEVLDKFGSPALDPNTQKFKEPRKYFWDAGEELAKPTHPTRKLYATNNPGNNRGPLNTVNATDLDIQDGDLTLYPNYPTISFANKAQLASGLLDYLEGKDTFDQDEDTNTTELRDAVLGDMFHSSPIVIGRPPSFLSGEPGFGPAFDPTSFLVQHQDRTRRIYVGANDGMLHAFNAGDLQSGDNPATPWTENDYYDFGSGQEEFGYVPSFLLDTLKYIPRNDPRRYYYVDGSPSAADVWLPSSASDPTKDPDEWATALVTGMRQGGSGYLALNVTDPTDAQYPELLWEFDETDAPLGETWSEAVITRVKLKAGSSDLCGKITTDDGPCREQWVAIFGGGYRADGNPNDSAYVSDPGSGSWANESKGIFMVAMDTGQLVGQVAFDPDPTTVTNAMRYSIPSTPAVLDLDFDGYADVVYVGDLGGQMWRWDISDVGDDSTGSDGIMDNWPVGIFLKSDPAAMGGGAFHYHSIFFPPVATYLNGQLVLAFGSGERTDPLYPGNASVDDNNRFWVAGDRVPLGVDPTDPNSGWLTLFEDHATVGGVTRGLNDVSNLASDPDPADDGYYIVAPDGEKFITNHVLFGGVLLTLSFVPDNSNANACERFNTSNIWVFNLEDAGGLIDDTAPPGNDQRKQFLGPGAPTDPQISISKDKVVLIGQTSQGYVYEFDVPVDPPPPIELVFWRQLY